MTDKRCFIVVGVESSGTRYVTRMLISGGCRGSGEHHQPLVDQPGTWIPVVPVPADKPLVFRRSFPHGVGDGDSNWPDIEQMMNQVESAGYDQIVLLFCSRDENRIQDSHAKNFAGRSEECSSGILRRFDDVRRGLVARHPLTVEIPYLAFCNANFATTLLASLKLNHRATLESFVHGDLQYQAGHPDGPLFSTRFSTFRDFRTPWLQQWRHALNLGSRIHRKTWEVAYVAETLLSHQMLRDDRRGVGFGVGSEPLVRVFADKTAGILATDMLGKDWLSTHAGFSSLGNHPQVKTANVDMNWLNGEGGLDSVPREEFDFSWSVCSMDHCGAVWWTKRFLLNQMNTLKPGGVAVHTAEYTTTPGMPRSGGTVYLTRDDILDLEQLAFQLGYELAPVDWSLGDYPEDHIVDGPPFEGRVHLKAVAHHGWTTCVGFALRKPESGVFNVPVNETEARAAIQQHAANRSVT